MRKGALKTYNHNRSSCIMMMPSSFSETVNKVSGTIGIQAKDDEMVTRRDFIGLAAPKLLLIFRYHQSLHLSAVSFAVPWETLYL